MKTKTKAVLSLILMLALLVLFGYSAGYGWGAEKALSGKDIKLGLDLAGGVSITYQVVGEEKPSAEDMSDTIYKLQQRVTQYSTEAQVYQVGDNRIAIEIPGVSNADEILAQLGKPGSLSFMDVNGAEVLTGTDVKEATAATQQDNMGNVENVVRLVLTDEGAKKFAAATKAAYPNHDPIYIIFDGQIISYPAVQNEITDGNCVITGNFTAESASNLASTIRIGGLSLELEELQSKVVGAQLGNDAIQSALKAGAIGFALVAVLMIVIYLLPGFAAALALTMYVALVIIMLSAFDITLTLPGIAGIILGIGMAVDANIITFSRIREEIVAGRTVKAATTEGYKKAFSAILDGNVTTLIAAMVLGWKGTGPIRGFAQTLALGIILSMFTALVITRIFMWCFNEMGLDKAKLFGAKKRDKVFAFMKYRRIFVAVSVIIILAGFVGMGVHNSKGDDILNYSLDFKGGTETTVEFTQAYSLEDIYSQIVPKISDAIGDTNVQPQTVNENNQVIFKTKTLTVEERTALDNMLKADYGLTDEQIQTETISSTISHEMRSDAIVAVLLTAVFIMIYIWIRFGDLRFGTSAIVALIHDVLVTLTLYALARVSVGSTFIACMLTLVGYSINDTIVVFDRIRENLRAAGARPDKEKLQSVVNTSLSQTLSRSLFTSITTIIMVATLYIFGVASIREFALPLLVGLVAGTYSSICIASPLWYVLRTRFGKKAKAKK